MGCLLGNVQDFNLTDLQAGGDKTLTADAFKPKEGVRLATVSNGVAYMGTNGTIATRVRFAKAGRYELTVRASGSKAGTERRSMSKPKPAGACRPIRSNRR